LGLGTVVALVVSEVIGIGIFLTPADMARTLGSPGLLLLVWLTAGLMAVTGALAYGTLAARFPETGGTYVYLREAWGGTVAFLYGWKCLLVLDPGLTAAWAAGIAQYAAALLPLGPTAAKMVAMGTILILAGLNALGTRLGAGVLMAITVLKVLVLFVIIVFGFASSRGDLLNFVPFWERAAGSPPLGTALAVGFVAAFFSLGGWWDAAKATGEVRDPERSVPRALLLGVLGVIAIYVLATAAFVYLVPIAQMPLGQAFAAVVGEALFGPMGGKLLAAAVLATVLGSVASFVLMAPRVYQAMARDGTFPAALARLHPRWGTPVGAIALQAALACLVLALGSFNSIVAYFIFVTVAFVAAAVAGLFVLPARAGGRRPTAAIFLLLTAALLVLLAAGRPREAALGTAVVALGIPVHAVLRARGALKKETP
jgi:basic amino acid/polyamine antiporter, APA family